MYKIRIIDIMGTTDFYFESEQNYKEAKQLLKNTCAGSFVQQTPCHFYFHAHSCEASEKMTKFYETHS